MTKHATNYPYHAVKDEREVRRDVIQRDIEIALIHLNEAQREWSKSDLPGYEKVWEAIQKVDDAWAALTTHNHWKGGK